MLEREGDAVRFHPTLLAIAGHYRFESRACAPYRPNAKGRVERAIQDVRDNFFAARDFTSVADLNVQANLSAIASDERVRVVDPEVPDVVIADHPRSFDRLFAVVPSARIMLNSSVCIVRVSFMYNAPQRAGSGSPHSKGLCGYSGRYFSVRKRARADFILLLASSMLRSRRTKRPLRLTDEPRKGD